MGRTKAWDTKRKGPGLRCETLRQAVLRARKTLSGAQKTGKNRDFASATAIWQDFDKLWKKSKKKSRLHHPSLATVKRIVTNIRNTKLQQPAPLLPNLEGPGATTSQLYFLRQNVVKMHIGWHLPSSSVL